jgi:predicted esterase
MTNQPFHNVEDDERRCQQAEEPSPASRGFYADLCELENLQGAYALVKEKSPELGIDPLTFETIQAEGVDAFLKQLSHELRARTYQPARLEQPSSATHVAGSEGLAALRDLVVQAALKDLLESAFPPAFPIDLEPEKTIKWIAGNIDRGLSRVYAVSLNESLDAGGYERLVERASSRIGDPQLTGLLKEVLAASVQPGHPPHGLLAPLLADIAFEGVDQILQQAKTFGREGNFLHVQWRRMANQVVVLSDRDPRYDWILPAVKKRLREELSSLRYDLATVDETQSLDLTCGEPLRFLDFELRCVKRSGGTSRVQYRLVEKPNPRQGGNVPSRRCLLRGYDPLRFVRPCLKWIGRQQSCQFVRDTYRKVTSIQVGWRHLPITLYPVLALFFGWSSPWAWLCAGLIVVCNWQSVPAVMMWVWRYRWGVAMSVCGLAGMVCLYLSISDVRANLSREDPAPYMPPGFYLGQYNSSLDAEPVPYGVYVPPHFKHKRGPFPLIVFLHGYGERRRDFVFSVGVAHYIAGHFDGHIGNSQFEFVALFPIDPEGKWETDAQGVEDAMKVLDYVIKRHHIDPARVYLTGISSGGSGVWRLAETYPNRWAAVAPVSSFIQPDVQKVRHIPAWIFHGAKDIAAPVGGDRNLVQKLKAAQADVRYTEAPDRGHNMRGVYDSQELYDWFATKKRED